MKTLRKPFSFYIKKRRFSLFIPSDRCRSTSFTYYIIYRCQRRVCRRDKRESLLLLLLFLSSSSLYSIQYLCGKFTPGATSPHRVNPTRVGCTFYAQRYAKRKYFIQYTKRYYRAFSYTTIIMHNTIRSIRIILLLL